MSLKRINKVRNIFCRKWNADIPSDALTKSELPLFDTLGLARRRPILITYHGTFFIYVDGKEALTMSESIVRKRRRISLEHRNKGGIVGCAFTFRHFHNCMTITKKSFTNFSVLFYFGRNLSILEKTLHQIALLDL